MPGAEGIQVTAPRLPDAAADLQAALLRYFSGPWRFTRTMRGADELAIGEAVGEALFQPGDANQLRYQESGQLQLANGERPLSFSRRFNYRMEGDTVRVDFADGLQAGQPYHHVQAQAEHHVDQRQGGDIHRAARHQKWPGDRGDNHRRSQQLLTWSGAVKAR